MKLALIADIHGNLAALEAVAADLRCRGVDQIVNLGDSVSGPLLPLETARFLMAEGWLCLAGNHERQLLTLSPDERGASDDYAFSRLTSREIEWLRKHPPTVRLNPEVFLCHGTPGSDVEYLLETVDDDGSRRASPAEVESRLGTETSPLVACAHTHIPRAVRSRSGQLVVNPGSVGLPALDALEPTPHVLETGSPDARYAIVERTTAGWVVSLISIPYDHESMARLARERGRPEWEHALRTGYMP